MEYDEVDLWDWHRILIGDAPTIYLLEVFFRTLIIYLALVMTIRIMGKRMGGQLTLAEMAVMITLGAIISVPMQIYDRGILMGFTALVVAYLFQRGYNYLQVLNPRFEELNLGEVSLLIKDGKIQHEQLKAARISKNQLFSILRNKKVTHLSQVRRLYLEACGIFTLFQDSDAELLESSLILPEKRQKEIHNH